MAHNALPEDLITIVRLLEPSEAFLLQSFLESEGIRAVPADVHMTQANLWLMHATGGVRLQVPASQVERAKQRQTYLTQQFNQNSGSSGTSSNSSLGSGTTNTGG